MAYARFTKNAARRVVASTLRVERMPIGDTSAGRARSSGYAAQVLRAIVTSPVTSGTWNSPTNAGRAQVRTKNAAGAWVDDGSPVIVWNDHTLASNIANGKVVKLTLIAGEYWLNIADC
jgi:hypothetical protein